MNIQQILALLGPGGMGGMQPPGMTPGIGDMTGAGGGQMQRGGIPGIGGMVHIPGAPGMGQGGMGSAQIPGMGQPQQPPAQPMGFGQKMLQGLGGIRDKLTPVDPRIAATMDPQYLQTMRNQAMLQAGLGMMAASSRGGRFGESLAAGLGQGLGGFNQGIGQQYQMGKEQRAEQRQLDRQGIDDERYNANIAHRDAREQTEDQRYTQERADTNEWRKKQMDAEDRRLDIAQQRADKSDKQAMTYRDIDRLRDQFQKRQQKVQDSSQNAQDLLMLSADPKAADDPQAQVAMVFKFQRMLEPDSVTREAEYKLIEEARGVLESVKNLPDRWQHGDRLTQSQIDRMRGIATKLANSAQQRMSALDDYYGELSTRRQVDPFEVTGKQWSPAQKPNVIDFSKGIGAPQPVPGAPFRIVPPTGGSGNKRVTVDF